MDLQRSLSVVVRVTAMLWEVRTPGSGRRAFVGVADLGDEEAHKRAEERVARPDRRAARGARDPFLDPVEHLRAHRVDLHEDGDEVARCIPMSARATRGIFFASPQLRSTPSTLTATALDSPPGCVSWMRNTSSQRS